MKQVITHNIKEKAGMITGELKNKVDRLWEMFWTGGLTNPLDVIEQITYLMFIRDLDEMDNTRKKDSAMLDLSYESIFSGKDYLKWSALRDKPAETMYQIMRGELFPFIKTLHNDKASAYAICQVHSTSRAPM
jgi:type I restriction enzyme M protein